MVLLAVRQINKDVEAQCVCRVPIRTTQSRSTVRDRFPPFDEHASDFNLTGTHKYYLLPLVPRSASR